MREINASENSVTISFKEVVDAKFGIHDLDKVWAEGVTGEDLTLSKLIEEVSGLILNRSLFKDAGGSVFLGRIDDLRGVKEKPTGFDELIANIQNSTDFAERLFDGAGQSVITESVPPNSRHVIKVEYEKEVFKTPKKLSEKINDIEIRIERDSLETVSNNKIRILPSIYNRDVSIAGKQVTYTIKLPVRIDKTFKYVDFQFEPVVYDLSLLIRYYLVLKKETNKPSDLTDDICDSVIWTLLNLKRMGDHGQAERAKIGEENSTGIFESGDQLAAAYGMMIETPTIATYSRRGYGNHFIFYGANLDLGQLKKMIEDYIKVLGESDVKTPLSEKLGGLVSDDEVTKKEAQKLLTLTSAIGKLQTASQNKDFNKIFNRIVSKFNEMATKFAGGERQGKWGALKVLPLSSLVTIMVGKKKAIKSLLETAFNTIILLTNILKQLIDISKYFNIEGYVKEFIINTFKGVFSESKVRDIYTHFQGLLTLITETKTLGAGETITYTSLLKVADDIQTYIDWELNDILQPITEFFGRLIEVRDWEWNFTNVENKLKSITGDQPSSPA